MANLAQIYEDKLQQYQVGGTSQDPSYTDCYLQSLN